MGLPPAGAHGRGGPAPHRPAGRYAGHTRSPQPCRAPGRDRGLERERAHPRERDAPPGAAVPRPENADRARGWRGAALNGDVTSAGKITEAPFAHGRAHPPGAPAAAPQANANYPRWAPPGGSGPDTEWIICAQQAARTAYLQAARNRQAYAGREVWSRSVTWASPRPARRSRRSARQSARERDRSGCAISG